MKTLFKCLIACLLMAALIFTTAALTDNLSNIPFFGDIFNPEKGTQANVPTTRWIHESGSISFDIPTEWTVTDEGDLYPVFIAADQLGSLAINVERGGSDFFTNFSTVKEIFTTAYSSKGITVTSCTLTQFAGRQAIRIDMIHRGVSQTMIMIQTDDYSSVISFIFTHSATSQIDLVMNSVWLDD